MMNGSVAFSVIIPVYGCPSALPDLYDRLLKAMSAYNNSFEIIFVDDCDDMGSWDAVEDICREDDRVIGVSFTRNFGQQRAIRAGLDRAKGERIVIMDCDLQDRPEDIALLVSKSDEGYPIVYKKRKNRKENAIRLFLSRSFYRLYNYLTNGSYDGELCNFCIMTREVVDELKKFNEYDSDYIMLSRWLGFNYSVVELEDDERFEGKSSYSFRKRLNLAIEIITGYSNRPLIFTIKVGGIVTFASLIFILYLIIRKIMINDFEYGWPSLIASVFFVGGTILSAIGAVGLYVGKIFDEIKRRPLYVIREVINDKK